VPTLEVETEFVEPVTMLVAEEPGPVPVVSTPLVLPAALDELVMTMPVSGATKGRGASAPRRRP